ncbi:MAG: hypothetical protein ACI808_000874 [Paraglaciecola sp.]|jgi:hypothetical protein
MPQARKNKISLIDTPCHHPVSGCERVFPIRLCSEPLLCDES